MTQARAPRRRLAAAAAAVVGVALAALILVSGGCGSLSKPALETELLALGKNAPIRELQRRSISTRRSGKSASAELVYYRAPAEIPVPDGRPVVLVHGTPSTLFAWVELIHGGADFEGLSSRRDTYAIEVVGHGVAPGETDSYDFDTAANFVVDAITGLGLESVHLVGSSYGGEFAWRAALDAPELVASLTLLDSSGYERRPEDWLSEEVVMRENSLDKFGWRLNSRERITEALRPHFPVLPPDRVEEFFLVCENSTNWKAMIDLARHENGERQDELVNLQAPTLLLWGANDLAYPPEIYARRFERDIPEAELILFPDTGHYPHEQRPAAVIEALERFYSSVEVR